MLFAVRQPFSLWTARRVLSVARCTFSTDDSSRPFPSPHPTRPIQNALPSKRGTNEFQLPSSLVEKTQHHEQTRDSSSCDSSSNLKCTAETDVLDQSSSVEHLFDTYKLLQVLERQGFTRTQAEIVMKGIKYRLRDSSAYIRQHLLQRSDLDNEMYLFKAGLSELRTEVQTMRRNNIQTLQAEGSVVTREVEVLEQKLREDVATMKSDVTLEVNNRKNEAGEELKAIDMKIQELNNRITVSLGDVRTDLEAVRWETIWKGMTGVAVVGLSLAGLGYVLTNYACRKAEEERIEQQRQLKLLQDEARHARTAEMEVIYS